MIRGTFIGLTAACAFVMSAGAASALEDAAILSRVYGYDSTTVPLKEPVAA